MNETEENSSETNHEPDDRSINNLSTFKDNARINRIYNRIFVAV